MTNRTEKQSEKTCFIFVEFSYGSPANYVRYSDMPIDFTLLGKPFVAVPNMEFTYPEQSGGLDEPPLKVDLPMNIFSLWISSDEITPEITVTVWELQTTDVHSSAKVRFHGTATRAFRNFSGNRGVVRVECDTVKKLMDIPLGIQANQQCLWQVGRGGCGVPIASLAETATVVSISRNTIVVSGLTTVASVGYFKHGFVIKDGIRLTIRDYGTGTTIVLVQNPPPTWLNQQISVFPGCDGAIETCRLAHFNREEDFAGLGIVIPDYHPIIESP